MYNPIAFFWPENFWGFCTRPSSFESTCRAGTVNMQLTYWQCDWVLWRRKSASCLWTVQCRFSTATTALAYLPITLKRKWNAVDIIETIVTSVAIWSMLRLKNIKFHKTVHLEEFLNFFFYESTRLLLLFTEISENSREKMSIICSSDKAPSIA